MLRKKTYFLSDLHLGAPYMGDIHEAERRVVRFLDSISHDAGRIFLVGDILDYWFEYKNVVPRGYVRFFGKLAELSDSGIEIVWLIGNHDIWIFDYLPQELGVKVCDGPIKVEIDEHKFFISHGDGLGVAPRKFMFLRKMFRNRLCQRLYASIHPRWTIPFALNWSNHSRKNGEKPMQTTHPLLNSLRDFSLTMLRKDPTIDFFIYGHLHIVSDELLRENARMIVLGEWLYTFSYAVFDGENVTLHTWKG